MVDPFHVPEVTVPSRELPETAKFVVVAFVEVEFVNTPVDGVVAPIGELSIVPPEIVILSATRASARVPVQVGVNVCVDPDEVITNPIFVSDVVANVWVEPVRPGE